MNDNIGTVLATLLYHEKTFALTGGALRRIVYRSTGRENPGSGWVTGFRHMRLDGLITRQGQPKVRGHDTYILTDRGRDRLARKETLPRASDVDPDAWLDDAHCYVRVTQQEGGDV